MISQDLCFTGGLSLHELRNFNFQLSNVVSKRPVVSLRKENVFFARLFSKTLRKYLVLNSLLRFLFYISTVSVASSPFSLSTRICFVIYLLNLS